jgi:hypothetical protein
VSIARVSNRFAARKPLGTAKPGQGDRKVNILSRSEEPLERRSRTAIAS